GKAGVNPKTRSREAKIQNGRQLDMCRGKLCPDVLGTPYTTRVDTYMKRLVNFLSWFT
ncbi:hypothetical protein HMPREF0178_04113, partial [Bilophila sp. 4_1_30]